MRLAILASFVVLLGGTAPLLADQSPPGAGWQRPSPAQIAAHHAAMEAGRAADIALLLGLRADQRAALDSFLAQAHGPARHEHARDHDRMRGDAQPAAPEGTVAALDRMTQDIDERDADAKQRIAATKRFYSSLTPDQQQRFDAMMHLMHAGPWHHGMDGHAMGGPGMGGLGMGGPGMGGPGMGGPDDDHQPMR